MKKSVCVVLFIGILMCLAAPCGADVNYDFVNRDGEVESKVGPMIRQIVEIIIGVGVGLCLVGVAIGACQWFAWFMQEDKTKGASRVKSGSIGVLVFGVFWAIAATGFKIAGIN